MPRLILAGGMIAAALLAVTPAAAGPFPWKAGDKPPVIAGVALGDAEQHALDVLGPPDDSREILGSDLLQYTTRGLEFTAMSGKIVAIRLLKPEAGSIGDLKVGDKARDVLLKWGAPQGGEGRIATFGTGTWTVSVHLAEKESTIADMTLASDRAKPAPDSSTFNVFHTQ